MNFRQIRILNDIRIFKIDETNMNIIRSLENYLIIIRIIGLNYLNNSEQIIVKNKGK